MRIEVKHRKEDGGRLMGAGTSCTMDFETVDQQTIGRKKFVYFSCSYQLINDKFVYDSCLYNVSCLFTNSSFLHI